MGANIGMPHDHLFWRIYDKQHTAIRSGDYKLFRTADSTFIYNLGEDIAESNNLEGKDLEIEQNLESYHLDWQNRIQEPIFLGLGQNKEYNRIHPDRFTKKPK